MKAMGMGTDSSLISFLIVKLFRVQESDRLAYQFDAAYTWHLPAVRCEMCRSYQSTNLGVPNLDIRGKLDEATYQSGQVTRQRFEELVAPLKALLKDDWPLLPGMGFGPLLGRVVKREKRDFLWLFGRTLLLRESAYDVLQGEGVTMNTGPAVMTSSRQRELRTDYIRVAQLRPVACMANKTLNYAVHRDCPVCGIRVVAWPERLFLRKKSIPMSTDIFAVAGCANVVAFTNIIVTERFRDIVRRRGLTNMVFEDVDLL